MEDARNLVKDLSKHYRQRGKAPIYKYEEAYLKTRMPATFAATSKVLSSINEPIQSILDLGCGPGTGVMAAEEKFGLLNATLVDKHKLCDRPVQIADLETYDPPQVDLALFSYSLGELERKELLLQRVFAKAKFLVIVESGTPRGFEVVRQAREVLLAQGAHILGPCPHAFACPMKEGNWCHFSVRLARTKEHKTLKGGSLGYEDEKFSYLIVSHHPHVVMGERILRHPMKHKGHMKFVLCTHEGKCEEVVISKRNGESYRVARKLEWGDIYRNNLKNRFLALPASSSLQPPRSVMLPTWPHSAPASHG